MDLSAEGCSFAAFRRRRIRIYGRAHYHESDSDCELPNEGNAVVAEDDRLSETDYAPADVSDSEGHGGDVREVDGGGLQHGEREVNVLTHPLNDRANSDGGEQVAPDGVDMSFAGGEDAEPRDYDDALSVDTEGFTEDYLRGQNIVSTARPPVAVLDGIAELQREMVIMQTTNGMTKTSCERIFGLLQKNALVISQQLPTWNGTFRTARRRVTAQTPPCRITVVGEEQGERVQLGPLPAFPQKEICRRRILTTYTLFECRLLDVVAFHAHLHGNHEEPDHRMEFDIGLDGVPESVSGGVSIDVLTLRFVPCRSVYTLAVLRPRRTGLQIPDSVILKSFVDDYNDILAGRTHPVNKVRLRYVICDAPKRARLLNMKNHTGYMSCQFCHIHGERGKRAVRFPCEDEQTLSAPRNRETFEACADEAERLAVADVDGVKGSSILRSIPGFDYVMSMPQERLHLADLGICRLLCRLMFKCRGVTHQSDYAKWAVSTDMLDEAMRSVRLPSDSSRRTRDFNFSAYKGEEYRNLYLALWPLVAETVNPAAREVWLHFVYVMRGLLVREEGFIAPERVRAWHRKFVNVFGKDASSYNVHAFTHIAILRTLGLLTETSAVRNESHYGDMKRRCMSGTPSVGLQGIQDCHVRNLGSHVCVRRTRISPRTTSKCDDSILYTEPHGFVRVTKVLPDGYEARRIAICPTNYPLPDLDFQTVLSYRVPNNCLTNVGEAITVTYGQVRGKGVMVKQYLSMLPLDVLLER